TGGKKTKEGGDGSRDLSVFTEEESGKTIDRKGKICYNTTLNGQFSFFARLSAAENLQSAV
ncbi:MAG: hypothetical protein II797_00320, partial [Clostridia bacterium]|nr:hypothetical protein [Clostridia bacterium]